MMLAELLPAWHTPTPRQRRRTSRASRQPHGLWGTRPPRASKGQNRGGKKTNLEGEGGIREGAGVSSGSIPQKPRRSGVGTRAQRHRRGSGTAPGWPRPRPRSGRGPRSRVGAPRPPPAPGQSERAARAAPLPAPLPVPYLAASGPVPSRAVPSAAGEAWVVF